MNSVHRRGVLRYAGLCFAVWSTSRIAAAFRTIGILAGVSGCSSPDNDEAAALPALTVGSIGDFPMGRTVLDLYRLVIVRDQRGLAAMSIGCTHQLCLLRPSGTQYICPCHGSEFGPGGERLSGPAPRGLPWYELVAAPNGTVSVRRDREVDPNWRLAPPEPPA